jgi:hypothetical protein
MSSTIPGATISRAELYAKAEDLHRRLQIDDSNPYRDWDYRLNDMFLTSLEKYHQPTLGEIKAAVDTQVARDTRTARLATLGGLGLVVGGFVGGALLGLPSGIRLGAMLGGMVLSQVVGGRAQARAQEGTFFSQQLSDWGRALAAQQPPAPAQPAAA